ncbi:MAG: hypothetical protein NWS01_08560 [Burkholderiales bacterium]|jgi:uncharacterized protein YdaU (DUF1376 family)|nr:hypothetical protein [Burkholderiales bacterium]
MIYYREAPSYQEYAASILADYNFRSLALSDRGAYYTLKLECWVNKRLPANPEVLSRVLEMTEDEVIRVLRMLGPFFEIENGFLYCPELVKYQKYLDVRKKAQSEGGKRGAAKTNAIHAKPPSKTRLSCDSLDKHIKDQISPDQYSTVINKEDLVADEWVTDYQQAERC